MLRFQWSNPFRKPGEPKIPSITGGGWVLFQFGRSIQLTKTRAAIVKRNHMTEWLLPDTLKSIKNKNEPTFREADICEAVMSSIIDFLIEYEQEFKNSKYGSIDRIARFTQSIIYTKIKIEDNEVMLYTNNEDMKIAVAKVCKEKHCNFRTIVSGTEAERWWEPVMRENCGIY